MSVRPKLRVLVADDSAFMRQLILNAINSCEDMEVVGLARNGSEAVNKAAELRPDVITLDVEMPVMSGLEALEKIMTTNPTPIVMVSSLTVDGARETLQAFERGAIDVIAKPQRAAAAVELAALIAPKIRAAASVRWDRPRRRTDTRATPISSWDYELVVLGCSTGGPAALQKIVPALPEGFSVPMVVAQHIPAGFTGPMAQRLNQQSNVTVVEAAHNMELLAGTVYIAPAGYQTRVARDRGRSYIEVLPPQYVSSPFRPCVNVLFSSAEVFAPRVLAIVLTGMGQDGLEGAKALYKAGGHIVAESEESAVIYGMPRVVVEAGLAHKVLDLDGVSAFLGALVKK